MLRKKAVAILLLERVCGLPSRPTDTSGADRLSGLVKARRRATLVVALDWIALAVLFFFRSSGPWLTLGPGEESVFTIGVLAVATHAGFRLAQLRTLRAVGQLIDELESDAPVA